ncbi:hypothetical protein C8C85_1968 [Flavobacterium sp. 103]|nr:hypothetical protein C8C85_1968 [Flavobacterium sp. 103]
MIKLSGFFVSDNCFFSNFVFMETIKLNIDLSVNQLIEAVKQLSPKDRLKVNEAIWNEDTEIPVEHQRIVLNRMTKAKANPERLLDWDEVSKNL